jgi:hypothetical protein
MGPWGGRGTRSGHRMCGLRRLASDPSRPSRTDHTGATRRRPRKRVPTTNTGHDEDKWGQLEREPRLDRVRQRGGERDGQQGGKERAGNRPARIAHEEEKQRGIGLQRQDPPHLGHDPRHPPGQVASRRGSGVPAAASRSSANCLVSSKLRVVPVAPMAVNCRCRLVNVPPKYFPG